MMTRLLVDEAAVQKKKKRGEIKKSVESQQPNYPGPAVKQTT
jgi:hypothetical protein